MKRLILSVASLLGALTVHAQSGSLSLPAGTTLRVRTIDPIDTNYSSGTKFGAALADPVTTAHGSVVIPRGAPVVLSAVNIEKSSRIKGRDRIDLKVDSITFNGRSYPVASTIAGSSGGKKGHRALRDTGIGAAGGAVIGAIAGGGTGAAIGSVVGGGGGAAVAAATGGKHLSIPPESVLTFQLQSPLRVR
jgi:hypothetical protein